MSSDAVAWAGAYPLPFDTARQRQRAKAVLKCLAQYAGVTGRSWCTMKVFLVETDLGHERTVQRGLSDLKACGVIVETGEWEVFYGRRYPIYQLNLDQGPRNTRDRLQAALQDAPDGVTELSPQELWGDIPGAPRGDGTVGLGVTAVSPKEEVNSQDKPSTGARDESFARLVSVCPRSMLRFADLSVARTAWEVLGRAGEDLDAIVAGLGDMGRHAEFKSRKHPPQLHDWLAKGMWRGWLPEPELPLEAPAAAAVDEARRPPVLPKDVADVVFPAGLAPFLGGAAWVEADRLLVCRLGMQRDEVEKRVLLALRAIGVGVTCVKDLEARSRRTEGVNS